VALAIPQNIREVLKEMGRYGGRVRAQKYSKEQLSRWGKLGGRPKKNAHDPTPGEITNGQDKRLLLHRD
jgi:hypothetical protein